MVIAKVRIFPRKSLAMRLPLLAMAALSCPHAMASGPVFDLDPASELDAGMPRSPGSDSQAIVLRLGGNNGAHLMQTGSFDHAATGRGGANVVTIAQRGADNQVNALQRGAFNIVDGIQIGENSHFDLKVNGSGNGVNHLQYGSDNYAGVGLDGANNSIAITQTGTGLSIVVTHHGDNDAAFISQRNY